MLTQIFYHFNILELSRKFNIKSFCPQFNFGDTNKFPSNEKCSFEKNLYAISKIFDEKIDLFSKIQYENFTFKILYCVW